ncbi:phosphopantothenoylcysteine decarboxylase [candidate division WOR-1 bacterium DG_54_3]|uniref:Coenzyme A biosynthesis bifunctional protein CoaBC n=1 Tax=candidate division WOR-1 bacterium DG_54_3 TaxID=1703775 RepID=A0A0S7Y3G1_UNCSA|nr:MAG: phosphopantothenoylcysteine decarboxylase [candidate division WOR-1 bacterium DG_54_3]
MLKSKTIIFGVSSSIAAYKACELVSRLKKLEAEVWVTMTEEATKLVTPLTFRTLSGNPVITDLFSPELPHLPVPHISLAKMAALVIIAPCTANIIGKLAGGIADDALTTMTLASNAKKLVAPAMNSEMWRNPMVSENVKKLKELNYEFIGPEEGKLACGDEDIGRMSEPEEIVNKAINLLVPEQDLKGKHVLVTAGGTREAIDPVRYISNRSSGKMGYAIARAARERGATVTLVSGPTNLDRPLDIRLIKVESAGGMLEAVLDYYNNAHAIIMAAAVSDFAPRKRNKKSKIKKKKEDIRIELKPTEDILKTIARQKGRKKRILVGFALETEDLIENAKKKMKEKDLDLIIANDDSNFEGNAIKFSIVDRNGKVEDYSQQPKDQAAHIILDRVKDLG